MSYPDEFFAIAPHCSLKRLEEPYLYDIENDELYELSEEAYQFLLKCLQGERVSVRKEDEEFIQYCLSENLIAPTETPIKREEVPHASPIPSLRYLEFQITDRCNLRCRHCYIGECLHRNIPFEKILRVLKEFEEIQGLRLLLSGGEPLLHPHFWKINDVLRDYAFRSVLLSNGILITREVARRLHVHEVQVSLDGMKEGHESIRGEGTFEKVLEAVDHLQEADIRVSIATMVHQKNLKEFDALASLIQSKNIGEWNVDVPCISGRMEESRDLWVSPSEAGPYLRYGYGGGLHSSEKNATCGAHLCAILPNGDVAKCGLFSREPVGRIDEGLRVCWERVPRIRLKELTCNCSEIEECRGGCRYRAKLQGDLFQPDLFQCYARGVLKGGERNDDQKGC
ncbi:MAG: radical SAM protein [Syntrophaceae bacterium]|nr:radical SAM protein [Syntrophaceae bacterium]